MKTYDEYMQNPEDMDFWALVSFFVKRGADYEACLDCGPELRKEYVTLYEANEAILAAQIARESRY